MHRLRPFEQPSDFMDRQADLEASLLIPAKNSGHALEKTALEAIRFFDRCFPGSYEIILIPNPSKNDRSDETLSIAEELARRHASIRVVPHLELPGKGAALRTGVAKARGKSIFFTDADLPYDLEFFERAQAKLREGFDLVTGNRRLLTSHFNVPVELLPVAYSRHRLGLAFNRVVRLFFGIPTTDTQAGIKGMSRELARQAFAKMECPGFFFDLEIFLTAKSRGMRQIELPVVLYLNTEKSTVRIFRESLLAAYWLTRIFLKQKKGAYA